VYKRQALHALRETLGLSDRDRAWAAILSATQGLTHTTWGALALRIDAARPLARGGVILSTYHSAKGSEFDHVFVLNEGLRRHGAHPPADDTRALYVALTRARHSVTLLRKEGDCHPTLISRAFQDTLHALTAQPCPIPTDEPFPAHLRYRIDGDPADLYITAPDLLRPEGRVATERYARSWPALTRTGLRLTSPDGLVGHLSQKGALNTCLSRVRSGAVVHATGATVLRCERDDEWYNRAGYTGTETHHHHVLPSFEIEEPFP
jgi:ATP-dependent DNA helicase RecQ